MAAQNSNFTEEEILGKAYDTRLMKRLLKYTHRYWKLFLLAVFLIFTSTLTDLARPYLTQVAIDDCISTGDTKSLSLLSLFFIGIIIAGFIFNLLQIYVLSYAGQSIIFNIRQEIFSHLQKMPLSFFDRNPVGRLVTRVTNDTEALNEMYTNVLVSLLKDIFILLGSALIMLKMNLSLALITIAMLPVVVLITVFFRARIRVIYRMVRVSLARINAVISENLSGIRVIHIFNREKQKLEEFNKINNDYYKSVKKQIITFGVFRPAVEMLSSLTVALMIWFGGLRMLEGTIEFGVLFAFINYISMFFHPINDLAEKYNMLQSAMASSERIFMIMDSKTEEDTGTKQLDTAGLKGSIEFKNVWFAYKDEEWVLKDVSFTAAPGTTTAIVGATGAGKTSIISLLNRFYEIQKGEIYIDSVNIREVCNESLRKCIGVVLQDVFLFSGTIKDNIRLNDKSISDADIKKVSEYVNADRFISKLASGYDEEVKERGVTFSSGQRQLLAFARALAFNPPILVLDEATANIDTETEVLIQDALKKITKNRTTIVIAHRLSTIQHADNIIVMHKGRIKEMGTHHELLAQKGMYYNLYQLQYKNI